MDCSVANPFAKSIRNSKQIIISKVGGADVAIINEDNLNLVTLLPSRSTVGNTVPHSTRELTQVGFVEVEQMALLSLKGEGPK